MPLLCQWCGCPNPEEREFCRRCQSPLLVISGSHREANAEELQAQVEEAALELQENLLERLTAQEEELRKLRESVGQLTAQVEELSRSVSLLDAGLAALTELLDRRQVVREGELLAAWERTASSEASRLKLWEQLWRLRETILARARKMGEGAERAVRRALQSAELSLTAGDSRRALRVLRQAWRRLPAHPELGLLVGELAAEQGDLELAEQAFRKLLQQDPQNLQALISLGTILADTGREEEARSWLEKAAKLAPEAFLPHFALGALEAAAGNHREARQHLEAALALEELPAAVFLLGLVELEAGHTQAAIGALERAVELEPHFEDAIYTLGLAYLARGWHRKALHCFRQVLELDPARLRYQEAVRLLVSRDEPGLPSQLTQRLQAALWAVEQGEGERAWEELERAAQEAAHPSVLAAAALLGVAVGRPLAAVRAASRVLRTQTEGAVRVAAWVALFEALRVAGRRRWLERFASQLLTSGAAAAEKGVAAYELAVAELETGQAGSQVEELGRLALELLPSELRVHALTVLGQLYLLREKYQDAVDYLEQAAAASSAPHIRAQLGLALLGQGERARAQELLRQAQREVASDLKTDLLDQLVRTAWLSGSGRQRS